MFEGFKKLIEVNKQYTEFPINVFSVNNDSINNYQIYGKTETIEGVTTGVGEKTENLIFNELESQSINGLTVTKNPNGTVLIKGKASQVTYLRLTSLTLNAERHFLAGCPPGGDANNGFCLNIAKTGYNGYDIGNGFTFAAQNEEYRINIIVRAGCTCENILFEPMLLSTSSTEIPSYIPYGYKLPMTVTSGEETENLLDENDITKGRYDSEGNFNYANNVNSYNFIEVEQATYTLTYTISGTGTIRIAYFDSNKDFISSETRNTYSSKQYTIQSGVKYIRFSLDTPFNTLMFTKGSTPPDHYIPYRYSTTAPIYIGDTQLMQGEYVDYEEQKIYKRTENLVPEIDDSAFWSPGYINQNGVIISTGNYGNNYRTSDFISVVPNKSYSFQCSLSGLYYGVLSYDEQKNVQGFIVEAQGSTYISSHSFTTNEDTAYIRMYVPYISISSTYYRPAMLVEGTSIPSSYIPYLQPTDPPVTLPTLPLFIKDNNISFNTTVQPTSFNFILNEFSSISLKQSQYITDTITNFPATINIPNPIHSNFEGYRIYGAADGAGVQTENLIFSTIPAANVDAGGKIISRSSSYLAIAQVEQGDSYSFLTEDVVLFAFYTVLPQMGDVAYDNVRHGGSETGGIPTFTAPITGYVVYRNVNGAPAMLVEGNIVPTSYIPYGYKFPMIVTRGEQSQSTPIYIGDSKLGEEEYVDYESGKVYKRTENNFPYAEAGEYAFGSQAKVVSNGEGEFNIIGKITNNLETSVIPLTKPFTFPSVEDEDRDTFFLGNPIQATNMNIRFYDENGVLITYYTFNSQWRLVYNYPSLSGKTAYGIGFGSNAYASYSVEAYYVYPMFAKDQSITEYIPYLQPTDPPVLFPTITLNTGNNTINFNTTIQPPQLDIKYYSWNIIQPKQYRNGTWYLPGAIE